MLTAVKHQESADPAPPPPSVAPGTQIHASRVEVRGPVRLVTQLLHKPQRLPLKPGAVPATPEPEDPASGWGFGRWLKDGIFTALF